MQGASKYYNSFNTIGGKHLHARFSNQRGMAGTRQRPSGARSGAKPKNAQPLSEDMYTDVERFHKSKLGFEDEEEALSESEGEENVYDLDAGASDSEDGEEDEEEEEDDEEDERIAMCTLKWAL